MRVCTAVVRALVVLTVVLREVLVPDVAACLFATLALLVTVGIKAQLPLPLHSI